MCCRNLPGQGYFERLDEAYSSGVAVSGQAISFKRGAELRYLDLIYQPLKDEAGQVFGIFVEGADVTERVLAGSPLRRSEAKFSAFAQASSHHIWTATADGKLDWFNEQVYAYSGAKAGELDGDGWGSIIHHDDIAMVQATWNTSVTHGQQYEAEFRIRRHDGAYRWHLVRGVPMRDPDGQVVRWIGGNTDIEEQKATAHALAKRTPRWRSKLAPRLQSATASGACPGTSCWWPISMAPSPRSIRPSPLPSVGASRT